MNTSEGNSYAIFRNHQEAEFVQIRLYVFKPIETISNYKLRCDKSAINMALKKDDALLE